MALEKQITGFPFSGETSQRDKKLLPAGALTSAQNLRFDKEGRLVKRFGYTSVTLEDTSGNPLDADVRRIFQRGNERCMIAGDSIYSQLDAADAFQAVGDYIEVGHISHDVVYRDPGHSLICVDSAVGGGLICYVWIQTSGTWTGSSASVYGRLWAMVTDEATGTILERVEIDTGGAGNLLSPRVFACGNGFMITFCEVTTGPVMSLKVVYKDWALPLSAGWGTATTLSAVVDYTTGVWASYDADAYLQFAYIAFYNTGGSVTVLRVNTLKTITHTVNVAKSGLQGIGVSAQPEQVWIAMGSTTEAWFTVHSLATAAVTAGPNALLGPAPLPRFFSWGRIGSTSMVLAYGGSDNSGGFSAVGSYSTHVATCTTSGYTALYNHKNLVPISRIESSTGRQYMVCVAALSEFQDTQYLVEVPTTAGARLRMVGVLARYTAPTTSTALGLRRMANINATDAGFMFATENAFRSSNVASGEYSGYSGVNGVERWSYEYRGEENALPVEYKDSVFFSGGVVSQYDGVGVAELGFAWAPYVELADDATSGTLTTGQTYGYQVTYEWVDGAGNRHVSAPSVMKSLAPSGTSIELTIRTLSLTMKNSVEIHVYRTNGNQTIPLRITEGDAGLVLNSPTVQAVTFLDTGGGGLDILYTVGGVVPNAIPITSKHLLAHKGRLWCASDSEVYFSKYDVQAEAPTLTDDFRVVLSEGKIQALAALDDSTLVFQSDRIYGVYGDGPNDRGEGQFSDPQKLPADIGTTNPRSVLSYSAGVIFEGPRGPHVIPRGLGAPVWIGGRVRDYFNVKGTNRVIGAHLVPEQNHVRLTLASGEILCLDYRASDMGEWTHYVTSVDSPEVAGVWGATHLVSSGYDTGMVRETLTTYADDGAFVQSVLETGEIRLVGLQGYQRIWRMLLLGENVGTCGITAEVAYDGTDAYTDTADVWTTYGSAGDQNEFAWHLRRQKVESVRFRFSDAVSGESGATPGLAYNGISLELGTKRGGQRIVPGHRSA